MDRDEAGRRELRALYRQVYDYRPPRLGDLVDVVDDLDFEVGDSDFDVDLYLEEADVVGLADAFLTGRPPDEDAILLDPSIDERLATVARALPGDPAIAEFAAYRAMARELATALSSVSGMPILERTSEERLRDREARAPRGGADRKPSTGSSRGASSPSSGPSPASSRSGRRPSRTSGLNSPQWHRDSRHRRGRRLRPPPPAPGRRGWTAIGACPGSGTGA